MKAIKKTVSLLLSIGMLLSTCSFNIAKADEPWSIKFDFGDGAVEDGYIQVLPDSSYSTEQGYGFLRMNGETTNINIDGMKGETAIPVSGGNSDDDALNGDFLEATEPDGFDKSRGDLPMSFAVRVPTQNQTYDVKVVMGRTDKDMRLNLSTEKKHYIMYDRIIPKGETVVKEFTVSVQNQDYKGDGSYKDNTISISVWGDNACINSIEITENPDRNTIWMLGDSTMGDCTQSSPIQNFATMASYGAGMSKYLGLGYGVANFAQGGLNSTDMARGYYNQFASRIKPGDYVIIGSGHNDSSKETLMNNLRQVVDNTLPKGAMVIIASPIERTVSYSDNKYQVTMADYRDAAREVAEEKGVPFIDLNTLTNEEYNRVGNPAAQYYMWNQWFYNSGNPKFNYDYTHPSPKGTDMITGTFFNEVIRLVEGNTTNDEVIAKLNPLYETLNHEVIDYPTEEFMKDGSDHIKKPEDNSHFPEALPPAVTSDYPLTVLDVDVDIDDDENKILKTITVKKDITLDQYAHVIAAFYDENGILLKLTKRNSDPTIPEGTNEIIDYNEYFPENTSYMKVMIFDGLFFEPANPDRELNMRPIALQYVYDHIDSYLIKNENFASYDMAVGDDIPSASNYIWSTRPGSTSDQKYYYGKDEDGTGYAVVGHGSTGNSYWFGCLNSANKITSGKVYLKADVRINNGRAILYIQEDGQFDKTPNAVTVQLDPKTSTITYGGKTLTGLSIENNKWYNIEYTLDLDSNDQSITVTDKATGEKITGNDPTDKVPENVAALAFRKDNQGEYEINITNITLARLRDPIPHKQYDINFTVKNSDGNAVPNAIITINGTSAYGDKIEQVKAMANAEGIASVSLINGDYTYTVSGSGCKPLTDQSFTVDKSGNDIEVTLEKSTNPTYTTTIEINDISGTPVENADIVVTDNIFNLPVTAKENNIYELEAGDYTIDVSKDGYKSVSKTVTVISDSNVTITMPKAYIYTDFSDVSDSWGMTVEGRASVTTANGMLELSLNSNNDTNNGIITKTFDEDILNVKKAELNFDWKPLVEINKGRESILRFDDSDGNIIFGLYQKGNVGLCYVDDSTLSAKGTKFTNVVNDWFNVNAIIDFENGTVDLTIKDASGNIVADNISISTNAQNLSAMIAQNYYSLSDMVIDNFALYEVE